MILFMGDIIVVGINCSFRRDSVRYLPHITYPHELFDQSGQAVVHFRSRQRAMKNRDTFRGHDAFAAEVCEGAFSLLIGRSDRRKENNCIEKNGR